MTLGASYSTNLDKMQQQIQDHNNQPEQFPPSVFWMNAKNFHLNNLQNLGLGRAVFEKKISGLTAIRFGGEYWHTDYQPKSFTIRYSAKLIITLPVSRRAVYTFQKNWRADLGARFEHSSLIDKSDVAPRVSLAYKTGKASQVSVAYGIFYQKPESQQLYASTKMGFTKATHYIMNYQRNDNQRTLRIEAYYKQYEDR